MVNKEFFAALADLVKEKGISEEAFIETLKNALASAYKKQYEGGAEVLVELDPERGTIEFKAIQHVVSEVVDRDKEISVEDAQELNPAYKEGDEIVRTFVPKDFGRIAAQTAKQVILQNSTRRSATIRSPLSPTRRENSWKASSASSTTATSMWNSAKRKSKGSCSRRIRRPPNAMFRETG